MEGVGTVRLDASQISCQASVQRVRSGLFFFFLFSQRFFLSVTLRLLRMVLFLGSLFSWQRCCGSRSKSVCAAYRGWSLAFGGWGIIFCSIMFCVVLGIIDSVLYRTVPHRAVP